MITYQDYLEAQNKTDFISQAIQKHMSDDMTKIAEIADLYDHQQNVTINNYIRTIFTLLGQSVEDFTATNNKITSNFFHRLNKQRCTYSLGNGISFASAQVVTNSNGEVEIVDAVKDHLGTRFDNDLADLAYKGLIHGLSFGFWNEDRLFVFPITEFVPLWDEDTGSLRAGIRYWRLNADKPLKVVFYEEDGFTKFKSRGKSVNDLEMEQDKTSYLVQYQRSEAAGEEMIGVSNYSRFPIIPFWGSKLHQSTLVGMRSKIDSHDLIRSGFANDLQDCSQIYWIIENCGGMSDADMARFRDRLKLHHIAGISNADDGAKVTPYTQEIPYQARKTYLDDIRAGIYEDFGGLDVHTVAAGATNDHIDAAYQPMDEEADDFEYQIIEFMQNLLELMGIEDVPLFQRNRVSNQKEQVEMVMLEANYLDDETILRKLPNITPDEIQKILSKTQQSGMQMFTPGESGSNEGQIDF